MKKKVAVAMSGGVDSSLTAAILLERGYDVIGITMKLADDEAYASDRQCCSLNEANDARAVASFLNVPHYVIDLHEQFQNRVVDYFIDEYLNGRTPNPCVVCNKYIKFGAMFDFINELGVDFLSTGHYARIEFINGNHYLKKAVDIKKDQSYVLYNLTPDQLAKIILPLGEQSKDDTRKLAEQLNLPVAHKPDSQEICFVPNDDYKSFLIHNANNNADALQTGDIVSTDGIVLGHHNGAAFYTIGQRKGLGIAAPEPLYVIDTDVKNKQVVVGGAGDVFGTSLTADNVHWIYPPTFPIKAEAKIRYGPRVADCVINAIDNDKIKVDFSEPQRAITPGQSVVFYDGDIVLGGGRIN